MADGPGNPTSPVNPLERLYGYQLRRAASAMLADLAAEMQGLELRISEVSVLLLIDANPGETQSRIGRVLGIQRANMATILATLTGRGLVTRLRRDGRSQGLTVTGPGRAAAADALDRIQRHEARFFAPEPAAAELAVRLHRLWSGRETRDTVDAPE